MNDEEKTPLKNSLRRDTRGIMNYRLESPNCSDVIWAKETPVKITQFNHTSIRTKANDQHQSTTPRPSLKKCFSSPLLPSQSPEHSSRAKKALIEQQKLCEELTKQFGDISDYKPRSLLDTLTENPDEMENLSEKLESKSKSLGNLNTADDDMDPFDDIEVFAQLEEEALKILKEKEANAAPKIPNVAEIDEDDDDLMMQIPMECLVDPNFATQQQPPPQVKSKFKFIPKSPVIPLLVDTNQSPPSTSNQPPVQNKCSPEEIEKKRQEALRRREEYLTQKNPVKRPSTNTENNPLNSSEKPAVSDQPAAKKRCTPEEIEQKRQEALKRREEHLKKKCTAEEIEKKRQEALKRREEYLKNKRAQNNSN